MGQPSLLDVYRRPEVVALDQHRVDVIEIFATIKTVSQLVLRVDSQSQFAAGGILETKESMCLFGKQTMLTKQHDC